MSNDEFTTHDGEAYSFDEWIETIAENNRERDGSSPRSVAEVVVVTPQYLEHDEPGYAILYAGTPYCDTRRWPSEILDGRHASEYVPDWDLIPSSTDDPSLRELAVDVVTVALKIYYDQCEDGWTQYDPETGEPKHEISRYRDI